MSLSVTAPNITPAVFFRGRLVRPRVVGDLLLALVRVVQSRFCLPAHMMARIKVFLADPVITCGEDRLRFEAFSACCGVYARVDLLAEGVEGSLLAEGTTNVDFNPTMRAALARLRDSEPTALTIGAGEIGLESEGESVIERKVALPVRWLKSFVEVQSYQARMDLRFEVGGVDARRFLNSLPGGGTGGRAVSVVRARAGLRVSMLSEGVRVGGLKRLNMLADIGRHARRLRVYSSGMDEASAWELDCGDARMVVVLSPDVWRGFSGEGQALSLLAEQLPETTVDRVLAALGWQAGIDTGQMACDLSLEPASIRAALARLGARGLVGYDLAEQRYFQRRLPFDLSRVEEMQPRLVAARRLVAESGVRILVQDDGQAEAWVRGTGCEHHVRFRPDGATCTCEWYAKHPKDRGPCKHILAVQIATGDSYAD